MLTEDTLPVLQQLIEALLANFSALFATLPTASVTLAEHSCAAIAQFIAEAQSRLDAIDALVARHPLAPATVPRQRALAPALAVHTQLIRSYLPNARRYLTEMLEQTDGILAGELPLDREARSSLEHRSQDARLALLGVEMQLYRLPDCRGRIIFDTGFRLEGECGLDRCFC